MEAMSEIALAVEIEVIAARLSRASGPSTDQ